MSSFLLANSLEEFMANFSVNDVRRMRQNRIETLWLMFFDDRVELYSHVSSKIGRDLFFRNERGFLEASANNKNWFKVKKPLEKAEDFLSYTKEFYEGWEED